MEDFSKFAAWVRERLLEFFPDWLDFIPATWPDWALFLAAPIVSAGVIGLGLNGLFNKINESTQGFQRAGKILKGQPITDPSPATEEGLAQIEALVEQSRVEHAAQFEAILAHLRPTTETGPLAIGTDAAMKAAVAKLVNDDGHAAQQAGRALAMGNIAAGFDTLESEARSADAEIAEKWRRLGALAAGVDTARARAAYEKAFERQADDFWTCVQLARLRERAGDTGAAAEIAEIGVTLAQGERELAVAKLELADVRVSLGDLDTARNLHEQAAAELERLADKNPGSAEAQRDVSVSMNKLGDVLVKAGDLEGAKTRFEESLKVSERLADKNPGSAEAQRDVSVSMNKLGDVLVKAGDLEGAKTRFEESLKVSERLADKNPGSAEAQRDLIVSYAKLGGVFPRQGWWAKGFEVCKRLGAEGRLAPIDAWMLEDLRARAEMDT